MFVWIGFLVFTFPTREYVLYTEVMQGENDYSAVTYFTAKIVCVIDYPRRIKNYDISTTSIFAVSATTITHSFLINFL